MLQQFSPNMLKTFKLCPKKFEFMYIKGISMPVNDEIFETGKNIHALASYYLRGENIDKMQGALSPHEKELWEYLVSIKYFSCEVINTEYNLAVKIGNHFFGGRLDALVKHEDTYYILDYKTGSVPKNAQFDFQTMIYLLCVRAFFKADKVSFVYIDLRNKKEVCINLTEELVEEYEKRLTEIAERIDKEEFTFACKQASNSSFSSSLELPQGEGVTGPCEYNIICYH